MQGSRLTGGAEHTRVDGMFHFKAGRCAMRGLAQAANQAAARDKLMLGLLSPTSQPLAPSQAGCAVVLLPPAAPAVPARLALPSTQSSRLEAGSPVRSVEASRGKAEP